MAINLKQLREQAKLSQQQLAKILSISQSQVSRYEDAPDTVPYALLKQWCNALGTTPDQADQAESLATPVDPGDPYASLHARLNLLDEYCEAAARSPVPGAGGGAASGPSVDELKALTRRLRRKPNVVLTGKFDSGKSRLANSVMGQDRLPTRLQPATRLITIIRHTDDRPMWMKDTALREEVWILSKKFVLDDWENESNWTDSRIAIGGYDTLKDYGAHRERHCQVDAHYAVVFLDAPVLRACNVIDLPGRRNERDYADDDAKRAKEAYPMIDVVIFLSPIAGFLDGFDMLDLSVLIRALPAYEAVDPDFPTLGNLFVVATHAAAHLSDSDLSGALDVACDRLMVHMGETALAQRAKDIERAISKEDIRARFFGFLVEIETRRKPLHEALRVCLTTHLPRAHQKAMNQQLSAFQKRATGVLHQQVTAYRRMLKDIERTRKEFKGLAAREPARKRRTKEARMNVLHKIAALEERAVEGTSTIYATHTKVDQIEKLIRQKYSGKRDAKAEAQEYAASHLVEVIQTAVAVQAVRLSEELEAEVNTFLGEYELAASMPNDAKMPVMEIPFDSKGAFLGGVAAAGTVGALALWSASLGNLGAYILAAKAVSLLAALGISIPGGTAAVMAFIASIGGPITLAVGIGVVIAALCSAIFGESWETRLAKKIEKSLHEAGMFKKMVDGTRKYWGDTRQAFLSGAAAVEKDFADRLEKLRGIVENPGRSHEELEAQLKYAEAQYRFFAGIPIVAC